jgi:hypothetical protein
MYEWNSDQVSYICATRETNTLGDLKPSFTIFSNRCIVLSAAQETDIDKVIEGIKGPATGEKSGQQKSAA